MRKLKPCPFCGGEAEIIEADYGMYMTGYAVYCRKCCLKLGVTGRLGETYEWSPVFDTEAEAIAAWNSRADYHGYEQAAIEAWENIKAWNSRAERTCRIVERDEEPQDNVLVHDYTFSCGHCICWAHTYEPRYCPNCGAKVVGE